jgi:hypothetical protein
MEAPDGTPRHGARVMSSIRQVWPHLTDQDIRALNTWRWRAHTGHGPWNMTGARAEIHKAFVPYPSFRRREKGR